MMRSSKTRPGLLVCSGFSPSTERPVAARPDAQIDSAVLAESGDGLTGARVNRSQEPAGDVEQPAIASVGAAPVVQAARADRAGMRATSTPCAPVAGVERHEVVRAGQHEHQAVGHERIEQECALAGGKAPRDLQPRDVRRVDLVEGGELRGVRAAKVAAPGRVGAWRSRDSPLEASIGRQQSRAPPPGSHTRHHRR